MADDLRDDVATEADLPIEDFVARGNARDRGESVAPPDPSPPAPATPTPPASGAQAKSALDPRINPKSRKASIQAEIDDLTTAKHTTRREVEAAQAELQRLRAELAQVPAAPSPSSTPPPSPGPPPPAPPRAFAGPDDPEPLLEQFAQTPDPYGSWQRAVTRWEVRQETKRQYAAARAHTLYTSRTTKLREKLAAHEQHHPGAQAAWHPDVINLQFSTPERLGSTLGDLIVDSDHTAALLDHFSAHLDDFQRLSTLHPILIGRELGRLETRLAAASIGPAASAPPISRAKNLIKPMGNSPVVNDDAVEDEATLSVEEFIRRGNQRDARLNGRR